MTWPPASVPAPMTATEVGRNRASGRKRPEPMGRRRVMLQCSIHRRRAAWKPVPHDPRHAPVCMRITEKRLRMNDDPRWDPEMRAARQAMDAAAAQFPPVQLAEPLDQHRAVNDALQMSWARGGPAMEMTEDLWISARGRRVLCRLHRPRATGVLPVLVWFHGGGWVWSSVDTHDRLVRELAAAGGVATVLGGLCAVAGGEVSAGGAGMRRRGAAAGGGGGGLGARCVAHPARRRFGRRQPGARDRAGAARRRRAGAGGTAGGLSGHRPGFRAAELRRIRRGLRPDRGDDAGLLGSLSARSRRPRQPAGRAGAGGAEPACRRR